MTKITVKSICLFLFCSYLISGCEATPEEWDNADKSCKPYGGLAAHLWKEEHCRDGTIIMKRR